MNDPNDFHPKIRVEEGRDLKDLQCEAEVKVEIEISSSTAQMSGYMKVRTPRADEARSLLKWLCLPAVMLGIGLLLLLATGWNIMGG